MSGQIRFADGFKKDAVSQVVDRGQSCPPWPIRHVPIGRSGGAAKLVPANPGID